jgi:integrase
MSKQRPVKPYPDFPLTPHANGSWCKKIKGRLFYFGQWDDWQGALHEYLDQRDDLYAGRSPNRRRGSLTLGYGLDHYLSSKKLAQEAGEISARSYWEHERTCDHIAKVLGKNRPIAEIDVPALEKLRLELGRGFSRDSEIEAKERISPATLKGELTRARMAFLHLNEYLSEMPINYRKPLRSPSRRQLRQVVNERGPRDFSRDDLVAMIDAAPPQLKAMIYLGINCGFGNSDCGTLPLNKIDLDSGWHTYWRPKTHNPRRCSLWPETVDAVKEAIEHRPKPKSPQLAALVFLTRGGNSWYKASSFNVISAEFRKLLEVLGIYRGGVTGFYSLRRTFETVAATAGNQIAVDYIMGHVPPGNDMAAVYRQKMFNESLTKVTNHVRDWFTGKLNIE